MVWPTNKPAPHKCDFCDGQAWLQKTEFGKTWWFCEEDWHELVEVPDIMLAQQFV